MSGHTPGPYHRSFCTIYALQESGDYRIPKINRWCAHVQAARGTPEEEIVAVAVLFEAAPDLLAACKAALGFAGNVRGDDAGMVYQCLQMAIAKAEQP